MVSDCRGMRPGGRDGCQCHTGQRGLRATHWPTPAGCTLAGRARIARVQVVGRGMIILDTNVLYRLRIAGPVAGMLRGIVTGLGLTLAISEVTRDEYYAR